VSDELYTVDEVAVRFKVTRQTVYNWIKAGQLAAIKVGRSVRIEASALDRFIAVYCPSPARQDTKTPSSS
jgi:excisionase family DNA binding protein